MNSQSQLERRIEIYEEAVSKIDSNTYYLLPDLGIEDDEEYCDFLRQYLWDRSNETRQTPAARIARKALKEANLLWISSK